MAANQAIARLTNELKKINKAPVEGIHAVPSTKSMFVWHYAIIGPKGSPYEGGTYHGKLIFPQDYPFKPPAVMMLTPSGRFAVETHLCLSMSSFHPETWNPLWSVSSILIGLVSFMLEDEVTYGSITTSLAEKRHFAQQSMAYNCKDAAFRELFPDLVKAHASARSAARAQAADPATGQNAADDASEAQVDEAPRPRPKPETWTSLALTAILVAFVASVLYWVLQQRARSAV